MPRPVLKISEFSIACKAGDLGRVTEFIQGDFKWSQNNLDRLLHDAVGGGHVAVCRYLLENGAKVDSAFSSIESSETSTAISLFELFMEYGWKVNDPFFYGHVILPYTMENESLFKWLLDHGADPNIGPSPGPVLLKAIEDMKPNVVSHEEQVEKVNEWTERWILEASDAQKDSARQLVSGRLDSSTLASCEREGMDLARIHYRRKAWKRVRELDAIYSRQGWLRKYRSMPPYHGTGDTLNGAATKSTVPIIDLLVSYGAKFENSIALHLAAESHDADAERIPVMKRMIELGADINASDAVRGNIAVGTPLHCAVKAGKIARARLLLHEGADPQKTNQWGRTPLGLAHLSCCQEEFIDLFRGWL